MTQGVFEVSGIHHNEMEMKSFWNMRHMQSVLPHTPSARAFRKHMESQSTSSRVTDIEEIGGNGVIAKVEGVSVAAGNAKLMNRLGIAYKDAIMLEQLSIWLWMENMPVTS